MGYLIVALIGLLLGPTTFANEETESNPTAFFDRDGNLLPLDPNHPKIDWEPVLNNNGQNNQWNSIANLGSGCTANLVVPPNCSSDKMANQKAQVITNGHCTKAFKGEKGTVNFKSFKDTPRKNRVSIKDNKVLYTTQSTLDLAIIEVGMTYAQLKQLGIQPKNISTNKDSKKLTNISYPHVGLAEKDKYLRKATCDRGKETTIIDQFRYWDRQYAVKCAAIGGVSGSGLYDDTGELTALMNAGHMNTGHSPGKDTECMHDTCTYDRKGYPQREKSNFALDVTRLHNCYTDCKLDLNKPGCELPTKDSDLKNVIRNFRDNPQWKSRPTDGIPINTKGYKNVKIKVCSQGSASCDCSSSSGYTNLFNGGTAGRQQEVEIGPYIKGAGKPSFHLFCFLGQRPNGEWEHPRDRYQTPIFYADQSRPPFPFGGK